MDFSSLGKWIIVAGLGLAAIGLLVWLAGKSGLPFGNFPGDIRIERPRVTIHFPIVSWIVLSIILTAVVNLVLWFFRR
jgi:uncharacterized protein HemY